MSETFYSWLARYAAWVSEGGDAIETEEIRAHLVQGKVYGSQRFRRHIESLAGRCNEVRPRGQRENEPGTFLALGIDQVERLGLQLRAERLRW